MNTYIFIWLSLSWTWGSQPSIETGPMLYLYNYQTGENVSAEPATIGWDFEAAGPYGITRVNTSLLLGPRLPVE